MKKIVGILICIFMAISTISIGTAQNDTHITNLNIEPTIGNVAIDIQNACFDPDFVIIDIGTNVTWTNRDFSANLHSIVSESGEFISPIIPYGESYSYFFKRSDIYPYHDGFDLQMKGEILASPGGNKPPVKPTINGTNDGVKGITYNYTAVSYDPEHMNISYFFDWGDNTNSGWTPFVQSFTLVTASHQWNTKGTYIIKVQAKDIYENATSEWGTFEVSMPVSIHIPFHHFMEKLFERFPHIFPILRHIMGY